VNDTTVATINEPHNQPDLSATRLKHSDSGIVH